MTSIVRADNISTVAGTGTVTLEAGNTLDTSAGLVTPAGHVIQTLSDINGSEQQVSSTDWVDTNLSITITPKTATSSFLIQWCFENIYLTGSSSGVSFRVTKDGTPLFTPGVGYSIWSNDTGAHYNYSNLYVDYSSHTISAITYTIQVRLYDVSSPRADLNDAGYFQDTLVIQEIAG